MEYSSVLAVFQGCILQVLPIFRELSTLDNLEYSPKYLRCLYCGYVLLVLRVMYCSYSQHSQCLGRECCNTRLSVLGVQNVEYTRSVKYEVPLQSGRRDFWVGRLFRCFGSRWDQGTGEDPTQPLTLNPNLDPQTAAETGQNSP